jgi:hypothetical protein
MHPLDALPGLLLSVKLGPVAFLLLIPSCIIRQPPNMQLTKPHSSPPYSIPAYPSQYHTLPLRYSIPELYHDISQTLPSSTHQQAHPPTPPDSPPSISKQNPPTVIGAVAIQNLGTYDTLAQSIIAATCSPSSDTRTLVGP